MKTFSLYIPPENEYYTVNDFVEMLKKTPDNILNDFYIYAKFQSKYLEVMEKLKERGLVGRAFEDEEKISNNIEKALDGELRNLIVMLNNSVDEFEVFFTEERIKTLNLKTEEMWDVFTEQYPIEYLTNYPNTNEDGGD